MKALKSKFHGNIEVEKAISAIENMTHGSLLITGKAGTGKSTFLKEYASYCEANGVGILNSSKQHNLSSKKAKFY